jgi:general secretion pathway protein G
MKFGENRTMTTQQLTIRAAKRAASRGVTLVEVLIVVAIMALIAGGVSFMILPKYKDAQIKTAKTSARNIRQVATQYVALNNDVDCPSVQTLIAEKELDGSANTEDPWGQPYEIICEGDDITVISSGPDKQEGSEDDIVVGTVGAEG